MANSHKQSHLNRYRQVAEVLIRHGLRYLVSAFGLERFVPFQRGVAGFPHHAKRSTRPEHVRMALEELGATFIKLGQILSTRADLLPPEYQNELAKLQDQAPPVDRTAIEESIIAELGRSTADIFATFDFEPVAAASIGQAHAATLHDGTEVIVKVRRPGVVEQVEEDLEIIQNLAITASRRWEFAGNYDLPGLAQEFAQTLRAELDYIREGQNAERFAANLANNPSIHIPCVYWKTTTARVLTLERVRGIKINDLVALDAAGINRPALAERAAHIVLKMILEDGFYHADPHPGNFFIEPGGRIGLIDFGMAGTVDARTQEQLVDLFLAIASEDTDRLVDTLLMLGFTQRRVDRALLRRELGHLVSQYYGRPLGEISLGPLLTEALTIVRRHHLQLPSNLALLFKTLIMNEGLGNQLDPTFNMTKILVPYSRQLVLRQYSPGLWLRNFGRAGMDAARLGVELPQQLRRIMSELERGNLEVGLHPEAFDPLVRRFERLTNRIVLGIIAAAFINGLAILLLVYHPFAGVPWIGVFFVVGFLLACVLGMYLAISILRSRRK